MNHSLKGQSGRLRGVVLGGCLFLMGCPAGPSTPPPGTPNPQQRTGNSPKHPDFLDASTPSGQRFTPEQMVEYEKRRMQTFLLMQLTAAPPLEAAAMLQNAKPGEYDEGSLGHHRMRIFLQLASEEILDEELARAILGLGEALRQSSLASVPGDGLFRMVVEAMVKSHDYLGESEKGDALLDASVAAAREARRTALTSPALPASDPGSPAAPLPPPSAAPPASALPESPSSPSVSAAVSGPKGVRPRVISVGAGAAAHRDREWQSLLAHQTMRLARRDFPAADGLLEAECRAARDAMLANPDALNPAHDWLRLAEMRGQVARTAGQTELAEQIDKEREETVRSLAESHPDSVQHFALMVTVQDNEVGRLLRRDPTKAQERLTEIKSSVEMSKFAQDPALASVKKSWDAYTGMIKRSQFRHDLVGRPAPPFDVERWVHGEPLPLESLKGRVALVVFCQVNRANCVELYPWLNGLHEEWHDRGLEVIQVVRPTSMSWNSTAKRAETVRKRPTLPKTLPKLPDLNAPANPPDDPTAANRPAAAPAGPPAMSAKAPPDPAEAVTTAVEMLEQLATHYGHRFPTILVSPGTTMHDAYGVRGPPHLVVIDRQGNIRAVEDLPNEANRRSIRETLDQLLAK